MKKLLLFISLLVTLIVNLEINAQSLNFNWTPSPDTAVTGYRFYYRPSGTTNSYQINSVSGRLATNIVIAVNAYTIYEGYCSAVDTNGLEGTPSNKVKAEVMYASAFPSATSLTLLDNIPSNFSQFLLVDTPNFANLGGSVPNVTFTPTNAGFLKDSFAYRSPEIFSGQNVTNYYGVYKVQINTAPTIISVTPN